MEGIIIRCNIFLNNPNPHHRIVLLIKPANLAAIIGQFRGRTWVSMLVNHIIIFNDLFAARGRLW